MKVRREIKREDIKKDEKLNNSQCWLDKVKNAQEKKNVQKQRDESVAALKYKRVKIK